MGQGVASGRPSQTENSRTEGSGKVPHDGASGAKPNVLFIGVCNGGVWKTTNNGTTFEPVFDSEGSFSIGCVTLDLFAVFLAGSTALFPVYARDILELGPWGLGMLRAAPSCRRPSPPS